MEVPASPTTATFPDDSAMSSSSSPSHLPPAAHPQRQPQGHLTPWKATPPQTRDASVSLHHVTTPTLPAHRQQTQNVEMQVFQRIAHHAGLKITRSIVPTSTPHSRCATDETYTTDTNATAETAESAITHES